MKPRVRTQVLGGGLGGEKRDEKTSYSARKKV